MPASATLYLTTPSIDLCSLPKMVDSGFLESEQVRYADLLVEDCRLRCYELPHTELEEHLDETKSHVWQYGDSETLEALSEFIEDCGTVLSVVGPFDKDMDSASQQVLFHIAKQFHGVVFIHGHFYDVAGKSLTAECVVD